MNVDVPVADKRFTFALETYKSALLFYSNYADRAWSRFNALLTVDLAIAGLFGGALLRPASGPTNETFLIPLLGLLVSFVLYVQGAQDRYVMRSQLSQIEDIRKDLEEMLGAGEISTLFSPLDQATLASRRWPFIGLRSWRPTMLSVSYTAEITAILFAIFWVVAWFTLV